MAPSPSSASPPARSPASIGGAFFSEKKTATPPRPSAPKPVNIHFTASASANAPACARPRMIELRQSPTAALNWNMVQKVPFMREVTSSTGSPVSAASRTAQRER